MMFKQKFSIALLVSIFTLLIAGILLTYQHNKSYPSKTTSTKTNVSISFLSKNTVSPTPQVSKIISINEEFLVTRIIDGDTFEIETNQKVRLIGINTPELRKSKRDSPDCFGVQAAQKLSELILNKKVQLEKDISETDRFGRFLRYVYVNNIFVNKQLVELGFAFAKNYPPDSRYKETLINAEKKAQENNAGLWNECIREQE